MYGINRNGQFIQNKAMGINVYQDFSKSDQVSTLFITARNATFVIQSDPRYTKWYDLFVDFLHRVIKTIIQVTPYI